MASLVGDNEDYILSYDKLLNINKISARQYLDILFTDALCFNMDRHTYNYGLLRERKTGEIVCMAPNFDNNIALISRGYSDSAINSSGLLIELFGELLKERNIVYNPPAVYKEAVIEIADSTLQDEKIDRKYVADFIADRYGRIKRLTRSLDLR